MGLELAVLQEVVYRTARPRTVDVLRAAHDVQPGQVLQPADLQVVAEALPEDACPDLDPIVCFILE